MLHHISPTFSNNCHSHNEGFYNIQVWFIVLFIVDTVQWSRKSRMRSNSLWLISLKTMYMTLRLMKFSALNLFRLLYRTRAEHSKLYWRSMYVKLQGLIFLYFMNLLFKQSIRTVAIYQNAVSGAGK